MHGLQRWVEWRRNEGSVVQWFSHTERWRVKGNLGVVRRIPFCRLKVDWLKNVWLRKHLGCRKSEGNGAWHEWWQRACEWVCWFFTQKVNANFHETPQLLTVTTIWSLMGWRFFCGRGCNLQGVKGKFCSFFLSNFSSYFVFLFRCWRVLGTLLPFVPTTYV